MAFAYLVEAGTVKRGATESTTANLTTVLDHLLAEKGDYYKGKIDTQHDLTCHKYDQCYAIVYHQTKHGVGTPGTPWKTPTKIKMCRDDELNQTDTHSSTQKVVQPKTCEVHLASEVPASYNHEESESQDRMENVTIFSQPVALQSKEPQGVS